jgi:hypothetical protein
MCSILAKMNSDSQQKRAGACNGDALTSHRESPFDERLQAACAEDSGEGPTGEGKESLACSGCQNEAVVLKDDDLWIAGCFAERVESSGGRCIEDTIAEEKSRSGRDESAECADFFFVLAFVGTLVRGFNSSAPNLSSSCGVVVEHEHASSVTGSRGGSGDACWSGAYDNDIVAFHRSDSTTMPSRQIS